MLKAPIASSTTPDLSQVYDELFPICRSITGPGIRQSMEIMSQHMPLNIEGIASGTKVFDWTVPPEWKVNHARLTDPDGKVIVDFEDHNLHVVNFSESYTGEMELEELQNHLHSLPKLPDAIPYVTSYYNERWGFCLSDRARRKLKPGKYKIDISTEKYDGVLNYASTELPGATDKIILITSYLCHPSMANNELSGPLALLRVYHALASLPHRHHTFRFLLIPETIGSISYLSEHGDELKKRMSAGMVLTCLGGPSNRVNFKLSRSDWVGAPSEVDLLARHLTQHLADQFDTRPFTPTSGSDERQFCSPGFNLPMVQATRTRYGDYEEYHTSADNRDFMRIEQVEKSADTLAAVLEALDYIHQNLVNTSPYGEPQLGRRGLYPNMNSPLNRGYSSDNTVDSRTVLNRLLMVLSLSDGTRDLMQIAEKIGCAAVELIPIVRRLTEEGIIERSSVATEKAS